ncbi:MurR/RpiR family transcriptional regulator [Treponema sp. SP13]|uniref:MurR/RpiR family transcriptional regulator n=1 Tax=Treponema sp. SP13 TaxID=2789742 RepID=UPI003D92BE4E
MEKVNIAAIPLWEVQVRRSLNKLSASENRIADYVLNAPESVLSGSVRELAQNNGVSEATVVRFLHHIGYAGLKDFKIAISEERVLDRGRIPDDFALRPNDTMHDIKCKVFSGCMEALGDTLALLDDAEFEKAVDVLARASYIEIFGIGGAAAAARNALHNFRKIGIRVNYTASFNFEYMQPAHFDAGDAVIAISRSGETRDVVESVKIAKQKGAVVIAISDIGESSLSKLADCRLVATSRARMFSGDSIYERMAGIAVIHALYAGVAIRKGTQKEHSADE